MTPGIARVPHAFLRHAVEHASDGEVLFHANISTRNYPWLKDHVVQGATLLPAAAFAELALEAADYAGFDEVTELTLEAPLPVETDTCMQFTLHANRNASSRDFTVHARRGRGPWAVYARGTVGRTDGTRNADSISEPWPPADATRIPIDAVYAQLEASGLSYGPLFQHVQTASIRGNEVFATVALADALRASSPPFIVHPALLDAALHAAVLFRNHATTPLLPFAWTHLSIAVREATSLWVRLTQDNDTVAISLWTDTGERVGQGALALRAAGLTVGRALPTLAWFQAEGEDPFPDVAHAALISDGPFTSALRASLDGVFTCATGAELVKMASRGTPFSRIIVDASAHGESVVATVLETMQAILRCQDFASTPIFVVTRHAVAAVAGDSVNVEQGAVLGLVRAIRSEHPDRRIYLVDLDETPAHLAFFAPLEIALRRGVPLCPRIATRTDKSPAIAFTPGGTVLITGGTGALGQHVARHLVRHHAVRHLVLLSRQGFAAPGAEARYDELRELGAHVTILACDVSKREALAVCIASISNDHPLTAIIHTAAVTDDAPVADITRQRLDAVLAPKFRAAMHLDALTEGMPHTALVFFSSLAGLLGNPGQASYAAANTGLDAIAYARRARGLAALSIAFGPWLDTGIAAGLDARQRHRITSLGIRTLDVAEGLELFDRALANPSAPCLVAAEFDRAVLSTLGEGAPLLLRDDRRREGEPQSETRPRITLRGTELVDFVRQEIARIMGVSNIASIALDASLSQIGLDSLMALEVRKTLAAKSGVPLPTTLLFDFPTPLAIASKLEHELELSAREATLAPLAQGLDMLDAAIEKLATDDPIRRDFVTQMRARLARWTNVRAGAENASLAQTTNDDLFALIDQELDDINDTGDEP
jgi:NAD(P)-dependent dehydrogenase (short-subunit alcohol dehydrogenase family)